MGCWLSRSLVTILSAHLLVTLANRLGVPVAADGYGAPYIWAVSLGGAIYAFIGIILTYRLCCTLFSPSVSVLATLAVWLSSPLVFYMYSHPIMSHANDTFAYALYLRYLHATGYFLGIKEPVKAFSDHSRHLSKGIKACPSSRPRTFRRSPAVSYTHLTLPTNREV